MAILRSGALLATALSLAGCYSPELRDCTVACASVNDCAFGQVCGADQYCAAPEIAGHCSELPGDAGSDDRDAGVVDGKLDAPVDAPDLPTMLPLHLKIDGNGRATVSGQTTCEKQGPQNGDCHYEVTLGIPLTLTAEPYEDSTFDRWSGMPCDQQGATCTFIPTAAADIHARFRKED